MNDEFQIVRQGQVTYELIIEGIVRDQDNEYGALVIYVKPEKRGRPIKMRGRPGTKLSGQEFIANTVGYTMNGQDIFAAVYPRLPAGNYFTIDSSQYTTWNEQAITVFPGHVAQIEGVE